MLVNCCFYNTTKQKKTATRSFRRERHTATVRDVPNAGNAKDGIIAGLL